MKEWLVSKESIYSECLHSEWFSQLLNHLSQVAPFPFWLKQRDQLIFSSKSLNGQPMKQVMLDEDAQIFMGYPEDQNSYPAPLADEFCLLLQRILQEKCKNESELNNLSAEILDKYEELNLLYDLTQSLGTLFDLSRIFDIVLEKIQVALDVERASVMLFNEELQELEIVAAKGFNLDKLESPRISLEKSISGYVLRHGEALMVENLQNLPEEIVLTRQSEYNTQSFISVPIICSPIQVGKKKIGVINVTEKRQRKSFTSGDFKLLNSIAAIAAIAIYNNRLIEKVLEVERLKRDLEIAESIQLSFLPTQFPQQNDFQIYGRCRSAKNIGGDYFDFLLDQSQHLNMVIADVSGHSIGAALMMTNTRNVLRSLMQENLSVGEILQKANYLLFDDMNRAGLFISIFFLRYHRRSRQLVYANGGHHPVLWHQAKRNRITSLDADGLLLGVIPQVDFEEKMVQLEVGDLLVMYTDGLVETANPRGELFGLKNLKETMLEMSQFDTSKIVENIFLNVEKFAVSMVQTDDITLQVMKVTA